MMTRKVERVTIYRERGAELLVTIECQSDEKGFVFLPQIPHALDGTIWAADPTGRPLALSLEARETLKEVPFDSFAALVQANPAGLKSKNEKRIVGHAMNYFLVKDYDGRIVTELMDGFCLSPAAKLTQTIREMNPVMKVHWGRPNEAASIRLSYVTNTLSWKPKYRVEIHESKAHVALVAEINNAAEDLVNVDIQLATHIPMIVDEPSDLSVQTDDAKKGNKRSFQDDTVMMCSSAAVATPIRAGPDEDAFTLIKQCSSPSLICLC